MLVSKLGGLLDNRSFVCHSPVEHVKKEIHNILCSYYKVAQKQLVNNVYH